MKQILRSVIDVDGKIPQESLLRNYTYMAQSSLRLTSEEDADIWQFLRSYASDYGALPTIVSVKDYFEKNVDMEVVDRLAEIERYKKTYEFTDFENLVSEEVAKQKDQEMHVILKTANDALFEGVSIKRGKDVVNYKGHQGAMKYIMENAEDMLASDRGTRTKTNLPMDTDQARAEFEAALAAQSTMGIVTGLSRIDDVCRGIKPGELWIHAGFVGELKTSMALNWAYKAAFLLQHNVYYLSLEMPIEQIRRIIYVMHSNHPKFHGYPRISYRLVRDGEEHGKAITPEQIAFYREIIKDIEENRGTSYGNLIVRSPDEDYTTEKLRVDMEIEHQKCPLHMGIIDHFALMKPIKSTRNYYTDLNGIIRESKRLALTFNHGERLPLLGLLQINRTGKSDAKNNDGVYKMQALADANEAERSADVITTTYLDLERRQQARTKVGCLKNRDNPHFQPFEARIDWNTRYLKNQVEGITGLDQAMDAQTEEELLAGVTKPSDDEH